MQVRLALLILFRGCFLQFCRFWEPQPSFQAWLRIGVDLCEFSVISSSQDEEMSSGTEEIEAELMQKAIQGVQDFRYGIAKISQGLRKFRNHSENFAIPAKFRYARFFAMIAKFRYHRENYCA